MRDVLDGAYGTGAHPSAVFGAAVSICVDWRVPVYFCGDRQTARCFVSGFLERCAGSMKIQDLQRFQRIDLM